MKQQRSPSVGPYLLHVGLDHASITSFDEFPLSLPVVRNLEQLDFHPRVTFFVGENGSGKSTLLEALAVLCRLNPEGGSRNINFETARTHSNLHNHLRLARTGNVARDSYFLRAESFYNVATELNRIGGSHQDFHRQSHGESFLSLLHERFDGKGLYLMDEPEAALSPQRQLAFLAQVHYYASIGGQFVIATHSPIIMAYPEAWIYHFSETGIERVTYEETQHYQVTHAFMMQREKMLKVMMESVKEDREESQSQGNLFD